MANMRSIIIKDLGRVDYDEYLLVSEHLQSADIEREDYLAALEDLKTFKEAQMKYLLFFRKFCKHHGFSSWEKLKVLKYLEWVFALNTYRSYFKPLNWKQKITIFEVIKTHLCKLKGVEEAFYMKVYLNCSKAEGNSTLMIERYKKLDIEILSTELKVKRLQKELDIMEFAESISTNSTNILDNINKILVLSLSLKNNL